MGVQKHQCLCARSPVRQGHPGYVARRGGWCSVPAGPRTMGRIRGAGGRGSAAPCCSELRPEHQAGAVDGKHV